MPLKASDEQSKTVIGIHKGTDEEVWIEEVKDTAVDEGGVVAHKVPAANRPTGGRYPTPRECRDQGGHAGS